MNLWPSNSYIPCENAKGLGTYCIYWLGTCYSSLYLCCSFAPNMSSQYLAHTKMYERHIHKAVFEQTKWIDAQGSIIRLAATFMSRAGDKSECRVSLSCGGRAICNGHQRLSQ